MLVACSSRPLLAAPGSSRHVHRVFGGGSSSRPLSVPASATTRGVTGVEQGTQLDVAAFTRVVHAMHDRGSLGVI